MHRHLFRRRGPSAATCLALSLVLVLAGCGGDDNPTSPGGGATSDPLAYTAGQAMVFAAELGARLPQWYSGDLSGVDKAAVWVPETMSWNFDLQLWDESVTLPSSAGILVFVQLQYYAGETAQQSAEGIDRIHLVMSVGIQESTYENESNNSTLNADFDTDLTVVETSPGNYSVAGGGTGSLVATTTRNGVFDEDYRQGILATWDVDVAAGGCPSGTAQLSHQGTVFNFTLNGTTSAAWSRILPGGGAGGSGTTTLPCGS